MRRESRPHSYDNFMDSRFRGNDNLTIFLISEIAPNHGSDNYFRKTLDIVFFSAYISICFDGHPLGKDEIGKMDHDSQDFQDSGRMGSSLTIGNHGFLYEINEKLLEYCISS
jgi:hypothetical protein